MTRLFNERFIDGSFDETWPDGKTEDTDCSVEENTAIPFPFNFDNALSWRDKCLEVAIDGSGGDHAYIGGDLVNLSDEEDTWFRVEFFVLVNGLDTPGNEGRIAVVKDSAALLLYRVLLRNDGGVFKIKLTTRLNGVAFTDYLSDEISMGIMYRVEVKWDITNHQFEWRINGVTQDSAALTDTHAIGIDAITSLGLLSVAAGKNMTVYIDNVAIDDADWVGSEISRQVIVAGTTFNDSGSGHNIVVGSVPYYEV